MSAGGCVDRFAKLTGSIVANHTSFGMTTGKALERIKRSMARKAPGPLEPARFLDWIARGLDRTSILSRLVDVQKIYRWQEAYGDVVFKAAMDNGLRIVDVRKDFLVADDYAGKFCADGMHPSEAGHDAILESFLSYVRSA